MYKTETETKIGMMKISIKDTEATIEYILHEIEEKHERIDKLKLLITLKKQEITQLKRTRENGGIIASIFIVAEELINMKQKIEEEQTKTDYTNTKQTI